MCNRSVSCVCVCEEPSVGMHFRAYGYARGSPERAYLVPNQGLLFQAHRFRVERENSRQAFAFPGSASGGQWVPKASSICPLVQDNWAAIEITGPDDCIVKRSFICK